MLYGERAAKRGATFRATGALGLKKEIPGVTDFLLPRNLSRPAMPNPMLEAVFGAAPTRTDRAKIKLLGEHPGVVVAAGPREVPPGMDLAALARRHGWKPGTVRQAARRYSGSTSHPAYHTTSWLICAALSLESGGEICRDIAIEIEELRGRWEERIEDAAKGPARRRKCVAA